MSRLKLFTLAGLLLGVCGIVCADTVTLEDGRVIKGKVISPAGAPTLKIKTSAGELSFPASMVTDIKLEDSDTAAKDKEIAALKDRIASLQIQLAAARVELAQARREIEQLRKAAGKTEPPPPTPVSVTPTVPPTSQPMHISGDIDILADLYNKFADDVSKACNGNYTMVQKNSMVAEACAWLKSEVERHERMTFTCQVTEVVKITTEDTWVIGVTTPTAADNSLPMSVARNRHVSPKWRMHIRVKTPAEDMLKINLNTPITFTGKVVYSPPVKSGTRGEDSAIALILATDRAGGSSSERADIGISLKDVTCDVAHLKALPVIE